MAALALFVGTVFLAVAGFLLADQLDHFLEGGCILSPRQKNENSREPRISAPSCFQKGWRIK